MVEEDTYLEGHVLQEEACTVVLLTLITAACTNPQSNLKPGSSYDL